MNHFVSILILTAMVGCSSSHQGIRVRAQSPTIDEAFRKLSLAVNVDGFQVERIDPKEFVIETTWRDIKEQEKGPDDKSSGTVRVLINLERRGSMFDVLVSPTIRYGNVVTIPAGGHPINEKWKRIVNSIVQKEARDED
jgi:hypothetical protein